jgi:hypothetical protein
MANKLAFAVKPGGLEVPVVVGMNGRAKGNADFLKVHS